MTNTLISHKHTYTGVKQGGWEFTEKKLPKVKGRFGGKSFKGILECCCYIQMYQSKNMQTWSIYNIQLNIFKWEKAV